MILLITEYGWQKGGPMNGNRAKKLRYLAQYDMKAEREEGRRYRVLTHNITHKWLWETVGTRAVYRMLKRKYYARRTASRI